MRSNPLDDLIKQEALERIDSLFWEREARRRHIPLPPRLANEKGLWRRQQTTGTYVLTDAGILQTRRLLQEDAKSRREGWSFWVTLLLSLITATTGLVGALIGLAAWHGRGAK
jgi:hypothetical protein